VFFHPKLNPFAARNYNKNNKRYNEFLKILYTEEAIVCIDNISYKSVSDMGHFFRDPRSRVVFDQSKRVFSEIKCLFWSFYTSSSSIQSNKIIISSKSAICLM